MKEYHVALSFAGEDREYVKRVATQLVRHGVKVFYDDFEQTKLWGKDLYIHLSDVYQNRANYTVAFISEAYKNKLWTNHEMRSAQARAFSENKEYILPAVFDESVEIPGIPKTIGYISLATIRPEDLAEKIVQKLRDTGILPIEEDKYRYSSDAKADIDFSVADQGEVTQIIAALKSRDWYIQSPAIEKIFSLDWSKLSQDQIFVLGRNCYQCACGGERKALAFLGNLRGQLPQLPTEVAKHLLNGMFYEIYFDSKGVFRRSKLKSGCLPELFAIQTVQRYADNILFIRQSLEPYKDSLAILPNLGPEAVMVDVEVDRKESLLITGLKSRGKELLISIENLNLEADFDVIHQTQVLYHSPFSIEILTAVLAKAWHIPQGQIKIQTSVQVPSGIHVRIPTGKVITRLIA